MPKDVKQKKRIRRVFTQEFKQEAVQMLLDGHSASSIVERLGLPRTNLLYKWKKVWRGMGTQHYVGACTSRRPLALRSR